MGYIDSANIKVFPTTQRQTQDASARMMTEYNLTSIINRLVDKKCFVISSDTLDSDGYFVIDNSRFEFNLFGYYFSIESIDKILNSITELNNKAKRKDSSVGAVLFSNDDVDSSKLAIVAEIKISGNEDTINNMSWQRLDGTDDSASGKYTGINFLLEPLSNYTQESYLVDGQTKKFCILQLIERPYEGDDYKGHSINTKYNLRIPANSKLKFITTPNNTSIRIDDGRLD